MRAAGTDALRSAFVQAVVTGQGERAAGQLRRDQAGGNQATPRPSIAIVQQDGVMRRKHDSRGEIAVPSPKAHAHRARMICPMPKPRRKSVPVAQRLPPRGHCRYSAGMAYVAAFRRLFRGGHWQQAVFAGRR